MIFMRPFSEYLDILKSETHTPDLHLAGSTPPLPPVITKATLSLSLNTKSYGRDFAALKALVAKATGCKPEEVQLKPGSTQACFQALAAVTKPGDAVIIEEPGYEPYLAAARFLGLKTLRYRRTAYLNQDLKNLRLLARQAKALIVSNPHCPTGWTYDDLTPLKELDLAVIVDEVFLPLFGGGVTKRPQVGALDRVVFLSGLSKSTGLGFARVGWTMSAPETARAIYRIGLLLHLDFPAPLVPVTDFVFKNWNSIMEPLLKLADANRPVVLEFARQRPGLLCHDFERGFFVMMKIPQRARSSVEFTAALLKEGVFVRDGAMFEMPGWIRFHILAPRKAFAEAWSKIIKHY
jgi:aspartate/methionine/tyrosine aminotransferase